MNEIKFERIYDLSVLVYSGMQLHPAEEAAGAQARVARHDFPDDMPSMCGGVEGLSPGGLSTMTWNSRPIRVPMWMGHGILTKRANE